MYIYIYIYIRSVYHCIQYIRQKQLVWYTHYIYIYTSHDIHCINQRKHQKQCWTVGPCNQRFIGWFKCKQNWKAYSNIRVCRGWRFRNLANGAGCLPDSSMRLQNWKGHWGVLNRLGTQTNPVSIRPPYARGYSILFLPEDVVFNKWHWMAWNGMAWYCITLHNMAEHGRTWHKVA